MGIRRITALLLRQGHIVGYKTRRSVDERREPLDLRQTHVPSNHEIVKGCPPVGESLRVP